MKKGSIRLSPHVRPKRYKINLKPDFETFLFDGEVSISIAILKPTSKLVLHSADLEIKSAKLTIGRNTYVPTITYNEAHETVTFTFRTPIPKGSAHLHLAFAGVLNNTMKGFYRSRYELDGKTHHMAVTQFESTDARRAFPCFDEPGHKAIFDVTLTVPKDRTAISNTIESGIEEHEGGYKAVTFAPSPKMSSYLVAFIVGHFEHIEKKTSRGVTVRVFATPGKKEQSKFALDTAVRCMEFYEQYFGIHYPLPVMDLIAIPDFSAGAMENWGAVTYRETMILVDPIHSSTATRQRVALVIAHELAHQWFGNLVTMEWWTHLWLNEGFATYLEYVAIDHLFPDWNIWNYFVYAEHSRALSLDGLKNTHAIEIDVHHPGEISEIFDAVSYSKGASVIRMLSVYLGEKLFRAGLKNYLVKHQFGNAATTDLWKAFERASKKPVRFLMKHWTREPGYPLVEAKVMKGKMALHQRRFISNGDHSPGTWVVPLSIKEVQGRTHDMVLTKSRHPVALRPDLPLKLNAGESTLMRTLYAPESLQLLGQAVAKGDIPSEADRFGIVRDAYALSESGDMHVDQYLRLLSAYKAEDSFIVWAHITEQLHRLNSLFFSSDVREHYRHFGRTVLSQAVETVGWKKMKAEKEERSLLRAALLFAAGSLGDIRVIEDARIHFDLLHTHREHIDPDLRGVVYNLVAQNGTSREYDMLMKQYRSEPLEEEKDRLLRALASFSDETLLKRVIHFAFSAEARGQDTLKAMNFIWSNPYGRDLAWSHLKKEWKNIGKRFGGGHLYARFIQPGSSETSIKRAKEIEAFFRKNPSQGIERTVRLVVEQIRSNAAWLGRDERRVRDFFTS